MISDAVGVTPGALYRHFKSKEDILLTLIKRYETDYLDRLSEEINADNDDASEALRQLMRFAGRFAEENPELTVFLSVIAAEFQGLHGKVGSELERIYAKYARLLRRVIETGKRQGHFDENLDTHSLAYMIIGFKEGAFLKFHYNRNVLDSGDYMRCFSHVLLRGLKPE